MIKPTSKNVLVAENIRPNVSSGGIVLQSLRDTDTKTATVLAIGPDVKFVSVGDKIYLDWSKGSVVNDEGSQRVIISEDHILMVVEEDTK